GGAGDGEAAAAAGAEARRGGRGVAVADDDLVEVHAELFSDDLGERGLVSLAVGRGAGEGGDGPARLHPDQSALEGPEAAHLDVAGHADAEQPAVAPFEALALLGAQGIVAGDLERARERPIVLAAVVVLPRRRRVGEGVGRDEVLPADLLGRLAQLGG